MKKRSGDKKADEKNRTRTSASTSKKKPAAKKSAGKTSSVKPAKKKAKEQTKSTPVSKAKPTKKKPAATSSKKTEPKSRVKTPVGKKSGVEKKPKIEKTESKKVSTALPPVPSKKISKTAAKKEAAAKRAASRGPIHKLADLSKQPSSRPLDRTLLGDAYRAALRSTIRDCGLPRRIAHGAILPVLLGEGRSGQLREHLDWALEERVPAYYLAESFLQSYLFIGFPRTINALGMLNQVNRTRRRSLGLAAESLNVPSEIPSLDRILGGPGGFGTNIKGRRIRLAEGPPMHLESPGEGPGSFERHAREWWRRGTELCKTIYGSQYARLRQNLGQIHPELADWLIFEGYGKVLARPVITPRERELWILPLLLSLDVPDQFFSHLRGATHLEVPISRLRGVIWVASAISGPEAFRQGTQALKEIEASPSNQSEGPPY